ncbi:MAG: hypothetical protein JW864_17440 [Spirochaetes bacterium]|nr:hypothetical protein [Spirochaetota bacterium]
MIDNILILLSSLMISIILALFSLDHFEEYNIIAGIVATTGAILAIVQFFRSKK